MEFEVVKVSAENYSLFQDLVAWRQTGSRQAPACEPISRQIEHELENPNLHLYAARDPDCFVGWISLVYIPKVGKWGGRGHLYVDELWVAPEYRRRGLGTALLAMADRVKTELRATGIRLYVNIDNPAAQRLYEKSGFLESGQAHFMEK